MSVERKNKQLEVLAKRWGVGNLPASLKRVQSRVRRRTSLERLRWLVSFASLSPEDVTGSAAQRLNFELFRFCREDGSKMPEIALQVVETRKKSGPEMRLLLPFTEKDLRTLANEVHGYLRALLAGEEIDIRVGKKGRLSRVLSGNFAASWHGELREVFLPCMVDLLQVEGPRIAKCAWEPCGNLFVRRKRGTYCSTAHGRKKRMQRYLEKYTPEQLKEKRFQSYVRSVERTKSKAVAAKVRRRKDKRQ